MKRMLANYYVLNGQYKKAMKEYIKGLRENPEDKFLKDKIVYLKKEVKKMNGQRKFKCTACNFEFEVPFGTGQTGDQMNCPSCGAQVYRVDNESGRRGRGFGGGKGRGGRCKRAGEQVNKVTQNNPPKAEKVGKD